MSAKQSRIEKLKLEVKRLEAERDGLKQVKWDRIDVDKTVICSIFKTRVAKGPC